jgi:hypothetical protein
MEFSGPQDIDDAVRITGEIVAERRAGKYPGGSISRPESRRSTVARRGLGIPYVPVDPRPLAVEGPIPFEVDPDQVDRGRFGHEETRKRLAEAVAARGLRPMKADGEPAYDLAWMQGGRAVVAEVKSIVPENEERQLRLGLGQVLRYRHQLRQRLPYEIIAVLAVETEPQDSSWIDLCDSLGVYLVWPETMSQLMVRLA